jgi:excisionase family DNA binding protein
MVKVRLEDITGDLLTVTEAAKALKVTRQNIHAAIERGRLKATRVGAVLLVARAALMAYGKSRKRTGRPPKAKKKSK